MITVSGAEERIKVRIRRFNPVKDKQPYYKDYEMPFSQGLTVLMALNYIYENMDTGLAHYFSCRTGKCGGCSVMVNGKAVLACTTLVEGDIVVEPLRGFEVVKDLVVCSDFHEPFEKRRNRK